MYLLFRLISVVPCITQAAKVVFVPISSATSLESEFSLSFEKFIPIAFISMLTKKITKNANPTIP